MEHEVIVSINLKKPLTMHFEIEKERQFLLETIHQEIHDLTSGRSFVYLMLKEFAIEAKEHPWKTAAKIAMIFTTVAALHPLILGAIACVNTYRLISWDDLYSSDSNIANIASQLYANLGHGVGYLVEGLELNIITNCVLLRGSYKRAKSLVVEHIYNKYIHSETQASEISEFLYTRKREALLMLG